MSPKTSNEGISQIHDASDLGQRLRGHVDFMSFGPFSSSYGVGLENGLMPNYWPHCHDHVRTVSECHRRKLLWTHEQSAKAPPG